VSATLPSLPYRRCGRKLPALSLGLWHNFGAEDSFDNARAIVRRAFDLGVVHFDLANNYGPPPGSAESVFGAILARDLAAHRDEMIVATKAGFEMWPGPYGDAGSRKHLLASLDASLTRFGLAYVDIFYHHRPDPDTPLEESMAALGDAVRSGRALYVGLSNYPAPLAAQAFRILAAQGTPCTVHQTRYNLLEREAQDGGVLAAAQAQGIGCVAYSPLAQGVSSDRYLNGDVPAGSRATRSRFLKPEDLTPPKLAIAPALAEPARARGQSLSQMALAWLLRSPAVASVLVGTSRAEQLGEACRAIAAPAFSETELAAIDGALAAA
jgi:L-glyceraldehyde 3-phosphate reductase